MSTALATIANALIEFILSLLRDPSAMAEFEEDPDGVLAHNGLGGITADDVQFVKPIIIDHPSVHPVARPPQVMVVRQMSSVSSTPHTRVVREIQSITQNFNVDARTTITDQSVNQNIWADGDVTQYFDQQSILAFGDGSNAAGQNIEQSVTDIDARDVAIGNTDTDVIINDSFNETLTDVDVILDTEVSDSFNDESDNEMVEIDISDSFNDNSDGSTHVDIEYTDIDADVDVTVVDTTIDAQIDWSTDYSASGNAGAVNSQQAGGDIITVVEDPAPVLEYAAPITDDVYGGDVFGDDIGHLGDQS